MIDTVDRQEKSGFVVNGIMGVPDNMGNRYRRKIQEWVNAGGVIGPYVKPTTDYQDWHNEISNTDKEMSRDWEDYYDSNPSVLASKPQAVKDRHTNKKALRAGKPE